MVKLTFNSSNQVKEQRDLTTYQKCGVKMTTSYGTLKHRKKPMLKENRNKEQVQIELLDITRDLMTLMGINPLTTDLNIMKDLLLRFVYNSEILKEIILDDTREVLKNVLTKEHLKIIKTKMKKDKSGRKTDDQVRGDEPTSNNKKEV